MSSKASLESVSTDTFKLVGELNFDTVPSLLKKSDSLLAGTAITLDLSGVTRSNSAGIALLLTWKEQAQQADKQLSLINVPEKMQTIAEFSGVNDLVN